MDYTYIFGASGDAVGFSGGGGIFDLNGRKIGQLKGTHVHTVRGTYVGELFEGMVVDRNTGDFGSIGTAAAANINPPRGLPASRREPCYRYTDVWNRLFW